MDLKEFVKDTDKSLEAIMQRLQNSVCSFCALTSVPVTFYSKRHDVIWKCDKVEKFCITNEAYEDLQSPCRQKLAEAMESSKHSSTPVTFICNTGLLNLCYTYKYKGKLIGYFIAGPVAMGKDQKTVIKEFYTRLAGENLDMPLLVSMTNDLKVYSLEDIQNMSSVFLDVVLASKSPEDVYDESDVYSMGSVTLMNYGGNSSVVYNALAYISNNYRIISNIDQIAEYVHVSKSYLSSIFKRETGVSIVDYINSLRLEHACFSLKNTKKSVTEISLAMGFRETSYFSKLFSEKYGVSPREYRKR